MHAVQPIDQKSSIEGLPNRSSADRFFLRKPDTSLSSKEGIRLPIASLPWLCCARPQLIHASNKINTRVAIVFLSVTRILRQVLIDQDFGLGYRKQTCCRLPLGALGGLHYGIDTPCSLQVKPAMSPLAKELNLPFLLNCQEQIRSRDAGIGGLDQRQACPGAYRVDI